MRFIGIDEDIAIVVLLRGAGNGHFLVPAMLSANRIGLHGENQILMHARIFPVNAGRIAVAARE